MYQVNLTDHDNISENFTFNTFTELRSSLINELNLWIESEYENMGHEECDRIWIDNFQQLIQVLALSTSLSEFESNTLRYPSGATLTIFKI